MFLDIFYKDNKLDIDDDIFCIRKQINLRSSKAIDLDKAFRKFKREIRVTEKYRKHLIKEQEKKNESTK